MITIRPVLKYPGSKWKIAKWIINHMPEHNTYLEPYFGSGAVLFNKPRSRVETINDLNGDVVNLFTVIRENPEELARAISMTPWSRQEYELSYIRSNAPLEDARRFLVRMHQAMGAKSSDRTGWRNSVSDAGGCGYTLKSWCEKLPEIIVECAERLKGVQIDCQPAVKLIERHNSENVLIYADPPYVLSTRSKRMYACEMSDEDHEELLSILVKHPGPVIISGYRCKLYDEYLRDWSNESIVVNAEAGRRRTEMIWINRKAQGSQINMF